MKRLIALFIAIATSLFVLINPSQVSAANNVIELWKPCQIVKTSPCIISIEAIGNDGRIVTATTDSSLFRSFPNNFASQPLSDGNYEWITPGIIHENGTEHTILQLFYFPLGTAYCWTEKDCANNVDEIIFDYSGGWFDSPQSPTHFPKLADDKQCGTSANPTYCIKGWGLNPNYSYRVKAKMPANFDFSFSIGYGKHGAITVEKNSAGENIMTLIATPAQHSFGWLKNSDPSAGTYQQQADVTDNIIKTFLHGVTSGNTQWLSRCDYGRGMSIWANGDVVQYPQWNSIDKTIELQVASTSQRADGSKNQGTFEVAVPLKIAQCLWGVDLSGTTTAMISASYPELGISEIITTSTRIENGIYYLSANGFHYSSPTIKVKVVQGGAGNTADIPKVTIFPSPVASPVSSAPAKEQVAAAKKSTITCIKGKVSKKVTAINPKCPTVYKKKG